ncbi:heavy metal-binding protein HIP-like [Amphiprion ocellaris]|uniref:heavy metal-binding protein HIP-like n=1 Tax=Amphiprion ocellaris TaxID=80972 RepID=UPI0024118CF1|nr:heavy metal-binding protein HIP-like [Amphiprion ocellaris]
MRGVAVFLALLLCLYWTWAQGEKAGGNRKEDVPFEIEGVKAAQDHSSRHANVTPDIWAELKELRDMAIEQKVELRYSQSDIAALKQENTVLKARLSTSEKQVEELKRESTDFEARLNASKNEAEELKMANAALEARMTSTDNEVLELKTQNAERPKVAFSLGLTDAGGVGPFNTDITLKFSKVFYNFGEAYNPVSGCFTAPVRGAYYFRFTMWEYRTSYSMTVSLFHNDKRVMWNFDRNDEFYVNMSNALILQLEKGDLVYMTLHSGYSLYDTANNLVTFSGFLLFPL